MLKLNVGFSRKSGEPNYGSRGASVNLELELESSLAGDPERLRDRIRFLFGLAKSSVQEELNAHSINGHPAASVSASANGHATSHRQDAIRPATASQIRALQAIARRNQVEALNIAQSRYGVEQLEDLALSEASELIDSLKGCQSLAGGGE